MRRVIRMHPGNHRPVVNDYDVVLRAKAQSTMSDVWQHTRYRDGADALRDAGMSEPDAPWASTVAGVVNSRSCRNMGSRYLLTSRASHSYLCQKMCGWYEQTVVVKRGRLAVRQFLQRPGEVRSADDNFEVLGAGL